MTKNPSVTCFSRFRISDYWPEFGQKGKETTTVADLMRHEVTHIFELHILWSLKLLKSQNLQEFLFTSASFVKPDNIYLKAGLPNAGPMGAEDCLRESIKQNKVKHQAEQGQTFKEYNWNLKERPGGKDPRSVRTRMASRGKASVSCNQQVFKILPFNF